MDEIVPFFAIAAIFIGLPWLIFHYVTKWKSAATLTTGDEQLLDELHDMARRLDERMCTIERIMTAENPEWRQACLPEAGSPLDDDILTRAPARARSRRGETA
jgi:phage shock protein B